MRRSYSRGIRTKSFLMNPDDSCCHWIKNGSFFHNPFIPILFSHCMQLKLILGVFLSVLLLSQTFPVAFSQSTLENQLLINDDSNTLDQTKLNTLQIPFIQNNGQAYSQVKFYANMFSGTVFVTDDDLTYVIQKNDTALVVKEQFLSTYDVSPIGLEKSTASVSYFKGEQENWQSEIPTFNVLSLGQIWNSIDVNLKVHGNNVEKIYMVNPGANVSDIKMKIDGANNLSISKSGELVISTDMGDVSMTAPVAFQVIDGKRNDIPVSYVIDGTSYEFVVGEYDHSKLLTIDPLLASTYIGGSHADQANAIAIDSTGRVYVAGFTVGSTTPDYPTTTGAYDTTYNSGTRDVIISRFDSDLNTLEKSTYIGSSSEDRANAIAIDSTGRVYVTGFTYDDDTDYPVTTGVYDRTHNGSTDVFVSRFDADLSTLQKSTLIGGSSSDSATGIAISNSGIYITGYSFDSALDFPTTLNSYDPTHNGGDDVFVSRFNADLS